jgi:isopentenyl-diphosphate Delta-isomerase
LIGDELVDRSTRKNEHINNALSTGQLNKNGLDEVLFVHQSIPNITSESIDLSTQIGELSLSSPFFINGMTGGGGDHTYKINQQFAVAAAHFNLPIAVGSQMAALKDSSQAYTYKVVREYHPNGIILANLGSEASVEQALRAIDMIQADGIQIHVNSIQELIMPEGDRDFTNWLTNIEKIVASVHIPVIVKEVGFGISYETARKLKEVGVQIIDVGGYGGTSFSKIENMRRVNQIIGFNQWGITTAASIAEIASNIATVDIIASGGINDAFNTTKSIALGANLVGFAGILLRKLKEDGQEGIISFFEKLFLETRLIMTALNVQNISQLQKVPLVITGDTYHWLNQRGIDTKRYSIDTR